MEQHLSTTHLIYLVIKYITRERAVIGTRSRCFLGNVKGLPDAYLKGLLAYRHNVDARRHRQAAVMIGNKRVDLTAVDGEHAHLLALKALNIDAALDGGYQLLSGQFFHTAGLLHGSDADVVKPDALTHHAHVSTEAEFDEVGHFDACHGNLEQCPFAIALGDINRHEFLKGLVINAL